MKVLLAALVLVSSFAASAQSRIVSVDALDLAYTGTLMFKHDNGKGPDRDETRFRVNLNFAQNIEQYVGLMWKAKAYINHSDVDFGSFDAQEKIWGIAGGALYNFQAEDVKNSFYAGALFGLEHATYEANGLDDKSGINMLLDLEGGKRFDLGQYSVANISYSPSIALTLKRYGGDIRDDYYKSGREIKFNFLKFDVLF